jgi:hypothetical protein
MATTTRGMSSLMQFLTIENRQRCDPTFKHLCLLQSSIGCWHGLGLETIQETIVIP